MKSEVSETKEAFFGTLGFLFVLLPVLLVGIPYKILSSPKHTLLFKLGAIRYLGIVPIIIGVIIYFWCSYSFVFFGKGTPLHYMPPKKLVITGLYRFVRNPMYIGAFLVLAGEVLLFQSKDLFIYFLVFFGVVILFVLFIEEPLLVKRFGVPYTQYRKSVRRWIPRLTPYRTTTSETGKRQHNEATKHYGGQNINMTNNNRSS